MRCLYSSTSGRGLCSLPLGHEGVHRFTRDISLVEQNDLDQEELARVANETMLRGRPGSKPIGIMNADIPEDAAFLRGARFRR